MTKLRKIVLLLLTVLVSHSVYAETGCQLPNGLVYTNKTDPGLVNWLLGATPIYENNSYLILEQQCIAPQSGNCRVCNGPFASALGLITGCTTGFIYGLQVSYILNCDIDAGNVFLMVLSGGAGVLFIYKRPKYYR